MIYLESFYYGIFSIIFGGAAGVGLSFVLYRIFKISQNVQWSLGFKSLLIASLCTIILTSLSTYLPLKKLDNQSIVESIKAE
jgi:putative ABC transport system permease protein